MLPHQSIKLGEYSITATLSNDATNHERRDVHYKVSDFITGVRCSQIDLHHVESFQILWHRTNVNQEPHA